MSIDLIQYRYHRHQHFHTTITIILIYMLIIGILSIILTKRRLHINPEEKSSKQKLFFRYFSIYFLGIMVTIFVLGLLFNYISGENVFSTLFKGSSNLIQGIFNLVGTIFAALVV